MNLLMLVQQTTGMGYKKVSSHDGGEYAGPCPFCQEGKDRFHLWPNSRQPQFWCRVCNRRGGNMVFLHLLLNISYTEAKQRLIDMGCEIGSGFHEDKLPAPCRRDFSSFTLDQQLVTRWHDKGRARAIDYFGQWGLTPTDIDNHSLGWGIYDGREGFSIPHWWIQDNQHYLKGVKFRHLDPDHRFSCVPGSSQRGVWNPKWITNPDGSRRGPLVDTLYIVEAEKDAALLDGLGIPAIAYMPERNWNAHLDTILANVCNTVIIYDNDGGKGLDKALTICKSLSYRPTLITTEGYKSPSDLAWQKGREEVRQWLQNL